MFVGHSTGLAIANAASAADLVIGASGGDASASVVPNGWGQVRIWDYSDPANPVLASSFDTVCSATVVDPSCDPNGTYFVHNGTAETTGNKVKAYISSYSDGKLILDVTDPCRVRLGLPAVVAVRFPLPHQGREVTTLCIAVGT